VLCEYSKFLIESNSYFSIRFETSTIIRNFRILTVTDFLLFNRMTSIFHLSNHANNQQHLLLTMVQVLYLFEVFILAHYYGPPSAETPTTETTIVRCHKNSWIYLTSTYYWWLLKPTIIIRFDSIHNEKTPFAQHYKECCSYQTSGRLRHNGLMCWSQAVESHCCWLRAC